MGIVRKAASIATLGKVGWRSRRERVARATVARDEARAELENVAALQSRLAGKAARARRAEARAERELREARGER